MYSKVDLCQHAFVYICCILWVLIYLSVIYFAAEIIAALTTGHFQSGYSGVRIPSDKASTIVCFVLFCF